MSAYIYIYIIYFVGIDISQIQNPTHSRSWTFETNPLAMGMEALAGLSSSRDSLEHVTDSKPNELKSLNI